MIKAFDRLSLDVTFLFIVKIAGIALTLATSVVLARILTPTEFGKYTFVIETIMLLSVPVGAGFQPLLAREIARIRRKEPIDEYRNITIWSLQQSFFFLLGSFPILILGLYCFQDWIRYPEVFATALPLFLIHPISQIRTGILRGFKKVTLSQIPETIVLPLLLILFLASMDLHGKVALNAQTVIGVNIFSTLLVSIIGIFLILKHTPITHQKPTNRDIHQKSKWFKELIPFIKSSTISILNNRINILLIGLILLPDEVATFKIALIGSTFVSFTLNNLNLLIAGDITELYHSGKTEKLKELIRKTTLLSTTGSVLTSMIFIFSGKTIISILYGPEYIGAYGPLLILSIGQFINCAIGPVGNILNMCDHQSYTLKGQLWGILAMVFLCIGLIPLWGIYGAAIATVITVVIWNMVLLRYTIKLTDIDPSLYGVFQNKIL